MFDNDLFYHCHREAVELLLIEDAGHESVDKVEDHGGAAGCLFATGRGSSRANNIVSCDKSESEQELQALTAWRLDRFPAAQPVHE